MRSKSIIDNKGKFVSVKCMSTVIVYAFISMKVQESATFQK